MSTLKPPRKITCQYCLHLSWYFLEHKTTAMVIDVFCIIVGGVMFILLFGSVLMIRNFFKGRR